MKPATLVVRSADECPFRLASETRRFGGSLRRYTVIGDPRCRIKAATCKGLGAGCPLRNGPIMIEVAP